MIERHSLDVMIDRLPYVLAEVRGEGHLDADMCVDPWIVTFAVPDYEGDETEGVAEARFYRLRQEERYLCAEMDGHSASLSEFLTLFDVDENRLKWRTAERLTNEFGEVVILDRFSVAPAWRGKGVGSLLVAEAVHHLRGDIALVGTKPFPTEGVEAMSDEQCHAATAKIAATYRRAGFRRYGRSDLFIADPHRDDWEIRRLKARAKFGL